MESEILDFEKDIMKKVPALIILVQNSRIIYANETFWKFFYSNSGNDELVPIKLDISEILEEPHIKEFENFLLSLDENEQSFETSLVNLAKNYMPVLIYGKLNFDIDFLRTIFNKFDEKSDLNQKNKKSTRKKSKPKQNKKSKKNEDEKSYLSYDLSVEDPFAILVCVDVTERSNAEYGLFSLLNGISDLVFIVNTERKIVYANQTAQEYLGKNYSEILEQHCFDICYNVRCEFSCPLDNVMTYNLPVNDIQIKRTVDGIDSYFLANYKPLTENSGEEKTQHFMVIWRNITDLHQKGDVIEDFSEMLHGIRDPIIILTPDLKITYMNTAALDFMGINRILFATGDSWGLEIFSESDNKKIKAAMQAVLRGKSAIYNQDITMMDHNSNNCHFLMSASPMHNSKMEIDSIMIHFRDVTTEKNAKSELSLLNEQIIRQNEQLKAYTDKLEQENIDLRNAKLITPVMELLKEEETERIDGGKYSEIEEGKIYIILEKKPNIIFNVMLDQLALKKPGLIISRQHPDFIKKEYNLENTPIIWLNKSKTDEKKLFYQPNLELLLHITKNFISSSKKSGDSPVIFIDGLEYLIIYNEFKKTLQFLEVLNEFIMTSKGIVIISIDEDTFDKKEFAFVKRNTYILK